MNLSVRRVIKCRNCHLFVLSEGQPCFVWCLFLISVPSQWCHPLGEVLGGKVRDRGEKRGVWGGLLCFVSKPFPYLDAFER